MTAFELPLNSTAQSYSQQQILDRLDKDTQSFYRGEGARISAGMEMTIAGHSALCWKVHGFDNPYEGMIDLDTCVIVSGHTVVSQGCAWKPATRAAIQRGCAELRASLKIS